MHGMLELHTLLELHTQYALRRCMVACSHRLPWRQIVAAQAPLPLLHVQAEGKPKAPSAPGADDGEELDPLHVLKVAKGPQAVFDVQYENPKLDLLDRKVLRCVCWLMRACWKGRERLGEGRLQQHASSADVAHKGCTAHPAVEMRCGVAMHKQQQGLRLKLVSQQDGLRQPGYVA